MDGARRVRLDRDVACAIGDAVGVAGVEAEFEAAGLPALELYAQRLAALRLGDFPDIMTGAGIAAMGRERRRVARQANRAELAERALGAAGRRFSISARFVDERLHLGRRKIAQLFELRPPAAAACTGFAIPAILGGHRIGINEPDAVFIMIEIALDAVGCRFFLECGIRRDQATEQLLKLDRRQRRALLLKRHERVR